MSRTARLILLALGVGSLGCESILGLEEGTPQDPASAGAGGMAAGGDGGAAGGGAGGGGGSAPVNCLGADVERTRAVFSGLGQPRGLQADDSHVYVLVKPDMRDNVRRFQHAPQIGTELEYFAQSDANTHDLEGLTLTTSHASWLTRGGLQAVVKTKLKSAGTTTNPSNVLLLDDPGSLTPFAEEGETLWFTTKYMTVQSLYESSFPHTTLPAGNFDIGVAGDGPIAVAGDSVFIGADPNIQVYDRSSGELDVFASASPDAMFTHGSYLYWIEGAALERTPLDDGMSEELMIDEQRTITDVAIQGSCVVWLDSEGTVRTRDLELLTAEPSVLATETSATSIEVTDSHAFISVGGLGTGSILAIPFDG